MVIELRGIEYEERLMVQWLNLKLRQNGDSLQIYKIKKRSNWIWDIWYKSNNKKKTRGTHDG